MTRLATPSLAADPVLPLRDVLLDGATGVGRELLRVKYRLGESLRVVYRTGDGLLSGRMFRPGRSRTAYERALAGGATPDQVRHDPELETVWWSFPRDRKLGDLGWLTEPGAGLAAELGLPGWRRTDVVQYVPERSLTVRALDGHGRTLAYGKAYGPESTPPSGLARRHHHVARALRAARAPVTSPDSLAWSDDRRVMMLEALPGRQWTELDGARLDHALARLGVAVAVLHDSAPAEGLPAFGRLRPDRVRRCADLVGLARPDVARRADKVAARLAATIPAPVQPVMLHGDCHPANLLVDGDTVALIDLDQMGTGAPAADLGSLVARLRYAAAVGELAVDRAADLELRFLSAYAGRRPLPTASSLAWHTAAALLAERALRAVSRVNRTGLAHLADLVAAADTTLDEGVPR